MTTILVEFNRKRKCERGERKKAVRPDKNYLLAFDRTHGGGRRQPLRDPRARAPDPGPGRDRGHAQSLAQAEGMNGMVN